MPENILVITHAPVVCTMHIFYIQVEDGINHVFLADFGLGRLLSETRVFGTVTKISGAPDKLRGETITTAVDVYAAGDICLVVNHCITIWTHIQ